MNVDRLLHVDSISYAVLFNLLSVCIFQCHRTSTAITEHSEVSRKTKKGQEDNKVTKNWKSLFYTTGHRPIKTRAVHSSACCNVHGTYQVTAAVIQSGVAVSRVVSVNVTATKLCCITVLYCVTAELQQQSSGVA
jgi:hypothetical protein